MDFEGMSRDTPLIGRVFPTQTQRNATDTYARHKRSTRKRINPITRHSGPGTSQRTARDAHLMQRNAAKGEQIPIRWPATWYAPEKRIRLGGNAAHNYARGTDWFSLVRSHEQPGRLLPELNLPARPVRSVVCRERGRINRDIWATVGLKIGSSKEFCLTAHE